MQKTQKFSTRALPLKPPLVPLVQKALTRRRGGGSFMLTHFRDAHFPQHACYVIVTITIISRGILDESIRHKTTASYRISLLERPSVLFLAGSGGDRTIRGGSFSFWDLNFRVKPRPRLTRKFWQIFEKISQKFIKIWSTTLFFIVVSVFEYNSTSSIPEPP